MTALAWLLIAVPAAAGLAGLLVRRRDLAVVLAYAGPGAALACAAAVSFANPQASYVLADFGTVTATAALDLSLGACAVALATGFVSLLVQLYSAAYLRDDPATRPSPRR
nr:hypothetical protein GCM10025732_14820 [Glycomyces mayteni]